MRRGWPKGNERKARERICRLRGRAGRVQGKSAALLLLLLLLCCCCCAMSQEEELKRSGESRGDEDV